MTSLPETPTLNETAEWFYVYGPDYAAGITSSMPIWDSYRRVGTYFPPRETTHEPLPTEPWHPLTLPVPRATPPVRRIYRVQAR